jgi:hypothetical protein
LLASWRSMTKIAGSGSGSTPKCHGSATLTLTINVPVLYMGRNDFHAGNNHYKGHWKGVGPENPYRPLDGTIKKCPGLSFFDRSNFSAVEIVQYAYSKPSHLEWSIPECDPKPVLRNRNYFSGSGSDFWQVTVLVPTSDKFRFRFMAPAPVPVPNLDHIKGCIKFLS